MLVNKNYFFQQFVSRILFLFILLKLKTINSLIHFKGITSFEEESLYLDKDDSIKYYLYHNSKFKTDKNYDIILQLKDLLNQNNDVSVYVYTPTIYIHNLKELIKYDSNNHLIDYRLRIDIN